ESVATTKVPAKAARARMRRVYQGFVSQPLAS
ncbi:MAG: hypothetical protein JWM74_1803, partial [Myxococcaceae bacterium]|nr:hypothetical protein [Myxococcaceae bacterium]